MFSNDVDTEWMFYVYIFCYNEFVVFVLNELCSDGWLGNKREKWSSRGRGTYPHALHAAHSSERPKGAKRSHRFERLNATGSTKCRYEVYKRDLIKSIVAF